MERNVSMEEISDGRLYGADDLVKADCGDCDGCHACCCGMGRSVVLDPCDVSRLGAGLGLSFEALLSRALELNVVDGLVLPNLRMEGEEERCPFLNESGRCSVHPLRPGICRLFPLGRFYEGRGFRYFLQTHECRRESRSKVRVRKWIDTPDFKRYERFVCDWHYLLKDLAAGLRRSGALGGDGGREMAMEVLRRFYLTPYAEGDFYRQFEARLQAMRALAEQRGYLRGEGEE